jgi:hypothetical protein
LSDRPPPRNLNMKRDEEYNRQIESEQEIILTLTPRANEHLYYTDHHRHASTGSDFDNQFIVSFSVNNLRANQVRYAFRKKFPRL